MPQTNIGKNHNPIIARSLLLNRGFLLKHKKNLHTLIIPKMKTTSKQTSRYESTYIVVKKRSHGTFMMSKNSTKSLRNI